MKKLCLVSLLAVLASAAPADRIRSTVDARVTRRLQGNLHRLALPDADRGPVDPLMAMNDVVLTFLPSAAQQAELDQFLAGQQNPNSPLYHQWLSPEEYGARFGLTPADESKVIAWLRSQGLTVSRQARGRNWVAFSGTARQVGMALRTEIHRFVAADGEHFANATEPSVPAALAGIAGGFIGLDDFLPESQARPVPLPEYNLGNSHYLVPEDLATIYDIAPLYKAGLDGTAQGIVVVGQSAVSIDDLRTFKTRHGLPANDPKMIPYGTDPGYTSSELEGALDLEWAGAVAPKATIYYVYGASAFSAMNYAINLNIAPVISVSYGTCEINASPLVYRAMMQQANAQGITVLAASGDSGAANCDRQGSAPLASKGLVALFPAVLPEVTAVGGTTFDDASGTYWGAANSSANGSALAYIPEKAWNESGTSGLGATGGGISRIYPKPSWQVGAGVTGSAFRQYPDVALSAAGHDAYIVVYHGSLAAVGGTSAGTPSFAGVVALLNQNQVAKGAQTRPGLGNINPQLYRLAQSAPNAFHDITSGDNVVPCTLGSPDCIEGKYGYAAGPGFDLATGLGSIDANNLFVNWNSKTSPVSVTLTLSAARITLNDTLKLTATVTSPNGGTPTGSVDFSVNYVSLGSVSLAASGASQTAEISVPAYLIGSGSSLIVASYSGDVAFSGGGAEKAVTVTVPAGTANISFTAPSAVWPSAPDPLGWTWQTPLTIRETAGTGAMLTGFTIDGQDQPLSKYFSGTTIPANGSISGSLVVHDLTAPSSRTFAVTGIDASGNTWTRQATVTYMPIPAVTYFLETATPLVINQNTADASCPWPVQVNVEDWGGSLGLITGFYVGGVDYTSQVASIFGTERLEAWSSLQGTVCVSGIKPPAADPVEVDLSTGQTQQVMVTFAGPPANPVTLSATPQSVAMEARDAGRFTQATLNLGVSDKAAEWSVTVLPGNRTTGWLTVSPLSGKGPAQLTLTARGAGFGNGAYRALLVFQSNNASPQTLTVPVMFILGPNSSGISISSMGNAASYKPVAAPGGMISVFGSQLAGATKLATGSPIDFANSGVTATVNGVPAPVVYASPTQLNVQVPYAAGAGPAVLGINNNGQVAGYLFQVAPAAPAIFTDANGAVFPKPSAKAGALATMYVTGIGEVTPALKTAYAPSTAVSGQAKPVLPVSVTVGGVEAFVQVAALAPNQIGTAQIGFLVPKGAAPGPQPVVITVGNWSSPPATLTVE